MPVRHSGTQSESCSFSERTHEIVGLFLIGFGVFLAMALWTFDPGDPAWGSYVNKQWLIQNYGGAVGAYVAGAMVQIFGAFSALIPLGLIVWGVTTFAGLRSWRLGWRELLGLVLLLSASGLLFKTFEIDPLFGATILPGGLIGYGVVTLLDEYLGSPGSWVTLSFVFLTAFVATTGFSVKKAISRFANAHVWFLSRLFMILRKVARRMAGWVVSTAKKSVSLPTNFFSRPSMRESRGEPAASYGDEERRRFYPHESDDEQNGSNSTPNSLQTDIGELIAEPDDMSFSSQEKIQENGGRHSRFLVENGPSFFGGGKFSARKLLALCGPAAEDELISPKNTPSILPEPVASSEGKACLQKDDASWPVGDKKNESLSPIVTTAEREENITPERDEGETQRKSATVGLRIWKKKSMDDDDYFLLQAGEKTFTGEKRSESFLDSMSTDAKHSTEIEAPAVDVKVRHAGDERESQTVRLEDNSLVQSNARAESPKKDKRITKSNKEYMLPSLDIFADPPPRGRVVDEAGIREKSLLLEQTLKEFGVVGKVKEVKTGPVITIFEYDPAPGVKVSKISGLADDLARALSALSVRIVAPIPGKPVVGIEVPNIERDAVFAKEVLASKEFKKAEAKLTMGLGKDILGRTAFTDLAKIPHLLIAGTTGSGKSVALNMMICSLLSRCTPREVRFLMIDPKMLELSIYEGIPHQLVPVVTEPKKAAAGLRGVLAEMEQRYKVMSEAGVRNIQSYNESIARRLGEQETKRRLKEPLSEGDASLDFLPYIVVVIDELADLMMVARREVEESMTRLAQMARASGIHLLVATQRPSVDVLTGLIKANFPSRMALRVATRTDSRTILDANGAERLLGKGDMLFVPPGSNIPVRIHGAYVSDNEISQLVGHWKSQGAAVFHDSWFVEEESASSSESNDEEYDERYDDAIALVSRTREASISLIQRHLRIGYNRAARIIERMEQEGIIGPADGVKRRQVLVSEIPGEEPVEVS